MKHINKILSAVIMFAFLANAGAQDTRFSQPTNHQLALNPAMMALTNQFRVQLNYRNQWSSIDKGYISYAGSAMYPLFLKTKKDTTANSSRLDFGVNVVDDKSGGFNRIYAAVSVGYGMKITHEHSIVAALNVGFLHYRFDNANQSFDEQFMWGSYDASNPTNEFLNLSKMAPDVGFGLLWHYVNDKGKLQAFLGFSGFHVNQPNLTVNEGSGKLPTRFSAQAGVKLSGNKLDFTPIVMYHVQGRFRQFTGGMLLAYKFQEKGNLVVGAWFKEKDAITLQAGYEHKWFYFTYSYDFGISKLNRTTKGLMTHEVCVAFKLAGKKSRGGGFL